MVGTRDSSVSKRMVREYGREGGREEGRKRGREEGRKGNGRGKRAITFASLGRS